MNITTYVNYEKYQQANQQFIANYPQGALVVFMGDSITEFWPYQRPTFFAQNNFIGRGIGGQVSHQMLLRFREDVLNLKPQVVVILAGTNDIAQNSGAIDLPRVADNIFSMAELARAHGVSVILCSVLPASDFPWRSGLQPVHRIVELNQLIKQYAVQHQIPYVDYYAAMNDGKGGLRVPDFTNAKDLVHPNAAGYALMESLIAPVIASVLQAGSNELI
ncbi:GDSL-type esterase/lipase family protein [Alishewanella sp. SMS8]|uniref:GDSL-type esterase/lipase family protein n=1 Tax=Alishewanella sp. SMS8 TaxID=2994676 RepID=UPI0027411DCB|nr:GDSL-type esterase/lipase family protein [Alishewanella sp. SMS8]MDP5206765.1 GDSL-type esterase/lipase family protein [Alishewanella sp. SMS9]MDP5458048.1 GDSL-type esterase/lipase family protein [Alishewanella sp. SMS8]